MKPESGAPPGDDATIQRPAVHGDAEQVRLRLADELTFARSELVRAGTLANTLFTVCGLLLGGGVTVLAATRKDLTLPAAVAVGAAATLIAVALTQLLLSVRPCLDGSYGFMRWAAAADAHQVLDELSDPAYPDDLERAVLLRHQAILARNKFTAVRAAATLLLAGLATGAVAATLVVLAAWDR